MEVPRLLVDAGLVALLTVVIFLFRKFFDKCREFKTNIRELNETVRTLHSDEKNHSEARKTLESKLERVTEQLENQRELLIEVGNSEETTVNVLRALKSNNVEGHQDIEASLKRNEQEIKDLYTILDNEIITKVDNIADIVSTLKTRWEIQLHPYMTISDKAHKHHNDNFIAVKESFQELADNVCRELSQCNQRLASMSEALAEHRDHYARDRRQFRPNHHRPYGRDTRSQRGLLRQAAYESRCGSHGHENRPPRRDCGPVRQEPPNRPLVDVIFDEDDEY